MHLMLKLFLEKNSEFILGPGRIELLQLIRDLGSLKKAAERMDMSYRWAWGRINKTQEGVGVALLERKPPPSRGRSWTLTPQAEQLIEWFSKVEQELSATLHRLEADMPAFLKGVEPGDDSGSERKKQKRRIVD